MWLLHGWVRGRRSTSKIHRQQQEDEGPAQIPQTSANKMEAGISQEGRARSVTSIRACSRRIHIPNVEKLSEIGGTDRDKFQPTDEEEITISLPSGNRWSLLGPKMCNEHPAIPLAWGTPRHQSTKNIRAMAQVMLRSAFPPRRRADRHETFRLPIVVTPANCSDARESIRTNSQQDKDEDVAKNQKVFARAHGV